jgi:peroxiredoxin
MQRLKPILFFLIVGGFAIYIIVHQTNQGDGGVLRIGQIAPDFTAKDMNGKTVQLRDYRGKLVFLNFWASWCVPCEQEMPDLNNINKTFKDRKFQMMMVSNDAVPEDAKAFLAKRRLDLPWYSDPGMLVSSKYHTTGWPETFIIDRNGHLLRHIIGPVNPQIMTQLESYMQDQEYADRAAR